MGVLYLALLLLIALGIVAAIIGMFGKGYEFREAEATLMSEKIAKCLSESSTLEEFEQFINSRTGKLSSEEKVNAFLDLLSKNCNFHAKNIKEGLGFVIISNGEELVRWKYSETDCALKERSTADSYPSCFTTEFDAQRNGATQTIVVSVSSNHNSRERPAKV